MNPAKERAVVKGLAEGKSAAAIAAETGVAPRTIRNAMATEDSGIRLRFLSAMEEAGLSDATMLQAVHEAVTQASRPFWNPKTNGWDAMPDHRTRASVALRALKMKGVERVKGASDNVGNIIVMSPLFDENVGDNDGFEETHDKISFEYEKTEDAVIVEEPDAED